MAAETLFFLFAKSLGFFCLSPLFRWLQVPFFIRFAFAILLCLLVAPITFPLKLPSSFVFLNMLKEALIGYLLGFIFSLLFEAAALGGEVVGAMMGFSLTEVFDPVQNSGTPLMSRFFSLCVATLFFSLDLHHNLIKILFENYTINLNSLLDATSFLFSQMLHFAFIPFAILSTFLVALAIAARLFPDFPIMWTAFPVQLLVGLVAVGVGVGFFPEIINHGFSYLLELLKRDIIVPLK